MSRDRDFAVLYACGDELRVVRACLGVGNRAELSAPCTICGAKGAGETGVLQDQTALDALAAYLNDNGLTHRPLICVLGGASVACQFHDMPPLKGPALRQAVELKSAQQLHFDMAEAVVALDAGTRLDRPDGPRLRVQVVAAKKETVDAAIALGDRMKTTVTHIVSASSALAMLCRRRGESDKGLRAALHIDERTTTLVVMENGLPCVATELSFGASDLTAALMRPIIAGNDVIQLDEQKANQIRERIGIPLPSMSIEDLGITGERVLPLLEPTLQKLAKQLTQWLTFASVNANRERVQRIELVGPGAQIPRMAETVAARVNIECAAGDWLTDIAMVPADDAATVPTLGVAAAAALYHGSLPDLVPTTVRRKRMAVRVRRVATLAGAPLAAAIFAFGLVVENLAVNVDPLTLQSQQRMMDVQRLLSVGKDCERKRQTIAAVNREFDGFARATPAWLGLFKELSILLPREYHANELTARQVDGRLRLTVTGEIQLTADGRRFGDVVQQTLVQFEKSPFFARVQPVSSNQSPTSGGAAGTLTIELDPAYPQGRPRS